MRRAAKVDANHAQIVEALRACGCTEKKRATAIANAKAGTAAVRARIASRPPWNCAECGKTALATVHQMRQTYCSNECMAKAYAHRMAGAANPNFRDAGRRTCEQCGAPYRRYNKAARFCSLRCRDEGSMHLRTNAKKDANHEGVVSRLQAGGAKVRDLSRAMFGVPDLLVWHVKQWWLVEVKNPKTGYGKRGLNKAQDKWANEWQGGPVYIVRTNDDVDAFLVGELDRLESVGGGKAEST